MNVAGSIGDWLSGLRDSIKESNIFGKAIDKIVGFLQKLINAFKTVIGFLAEKFAAPGFEWFGNLLEGLWNVLSWIGDKIVAVISSISGSLSGAVRDGGLNAIIDTAFNLINGVFIAKILHSLKEFADGFSSITGIFDAIADSFQYDAFMKLAKAILILAAALLILSLIDPEVLSESLGAVTILFADLVGSMKLFNMIGRTDGIIAMSSALVGISVALLILAAATKIMSTISLKDMATALMGVAAGMGILVGAVRLLPESNVKKAASAIKKMSTALLILAVALKIMSSMSWEEMGIGLITTVVGLGALVGAVNLLPKDSKLYSASSAIGRMAVAMVILASALKIMSTMSWEEMGIGLISMTAGLSAMIAAVRLLPNEAKLFSASTAISRLSVAMVILASALKIMSTMSWEEVAIGLVSMTVGLTAMVAAVHLLPKDTALKVLGLTSLATAMVILASALKIMATMSWDDIARSLVTLAGSLGILAIALNLMKNALPGAAALIIATGALALLTPILLILGMLSWESIAKGLVAIAGAFVIMGVAGYALASVIPAILGLSAALVLIGVGMLAIGAGLVAFGMGISSIVAGFTAMMGAMGIIATGIVTVISSIITGIIKGIGEGIVQLCVVIANSASAIGEAITAVILALCDSIITCAPKIAETILSVIVNVLESMVDFIPQIVTSLMELIIGIINALAENIPDVIAAIMNLIGSIFEGVIQALQNIDTTTLINGIAAVGLMSGLIMLLSAIVPFIPGAMVGILGIGAVVAEMGLVISAIGALALLPGLQWLITQGGNLLQAIGTAIGQFIGGIIGGIGKGISASFPQIATDLSNFMTNLQPFIEGAKSLDPTMLEGVKSLASVILTLTAANILDALTSWLTGGSSLTDFAQDLVPFGQAMATFSSIVTGRIDEGAVLAAANAGKIMADMASTLPNSGGVIGFFTGENDMGAFAAQLVPFGQAMATFSSVVTGRIDEGAVTAAANAGKAMAEMAETIPNTGGLVGWFTGENDLATFGAQIVPFGQAMAAFSEAISGKFDEGAVVAAANAGKAMAEMNAAIPETGGLKALFAGEKDMASFTKQLVPFGKAMAEFSAAITGKIDAGAVTAAANAGKAMAEMSHIDTNGISVAVQNVDKLVDMAKGMADVDFSGFSAFGDALGKVANKGIDAFIKAFSDAEDKASKAGKKLVDNVASGMEDNKKAVTSAVETVVSAATNALDDNYQDFYDAGSSLVDGFAKGISENDYKAAAKAKAMAEAAEKAAKKALDINSPSKVFRSIGSSVPEGFAMGIDMLGNEVKKSTVSMTDKSIDGVKNGISRIADVVNSDIDTQPTIRPVLDLSDVKAGANSINDMLGAGVPVSLLNNVGRINTLMTQRNQNGTIASVVSEIDKLNKNIEGMEHATYNINGVSFTEGSDVEEAFRTILRAAKIERRA